MKANPTDKAVSISYNVDANIGSTLELVDVLGKVILTTLIPAQDLESVSMELDVADLPTGTYFIKVSSQGRAKVKKLIVN